MSQSITLDELDRVGREVDLSDEAASALSATGLVEVLPACESGMVSAINAKVNEGLK